jgi:RNA polymerase sigma-70 factor (ECF subfamily)
MMLTDQMLIWKVKCGSSDALCRIYKKYRKDLLRLATVLLNDVGDAEDVVHDVFVSFSESTENLKMTGNLKSYLSTCVANRARNKNRMKRQRHTVGLNNAEGIISDLDAPDQWIVCSEELKQWSNALEQLPYEQREVVILHLRAEMKFRQIAQVQGVSISTVQGRYRYGLDKLRLILNSEVKK